jgi:hypothetical protein
LLWPDTKAPKRRQPNEALLGPLRR